MKTESSVIRYLGALGVLATVLALASNSRAWDARHVYTTTDSTTVTFTPGTQSVHHSVAQAPTVGRARCYFAQNAGVYADAFAMNGDVKCAHATLQVRTTDFKSFGWVTSGTAICIGYDNSSPYAQQALCPQEPGQ
ncbi:MAG: hypothetical protein IPG71_03795 [bacterium]|nr:hypothetical protein [bacterium]